METGFLLPTLEDPLTRPFWEGCARGELLVQRFVASGRLVWPPRPMDPHSRTLDHEWERVSGRGTVYSYVVPHPPLLPSYQELAPYNVILVTLDEDPSIRMVGNLLATPDGAVNEIDPATIRIGAPVRAVFQEVDGVHLPRWVRA
ncbi:MAG: OB-fold domain-containing protein [Acidimicrobiia bacterium]|nr:OB-fold domain-containing protein [Acidimicrobiia bacterium]